MKASCPPKPRSRVTQRHDVTRSDVCELWQRCPGGGDSALKEAWKAIQQKGSHPGWAGGSTTALPNALLPRAALGQTSGLQPPQREEAWPGLGLL